MDEGWNPAIKGRSKQTKFMIKKLMDQYSTDPPRPDCSDCKTRFQLPPELWRQYATNQQGGWRCQTCQTFRQKFGTRIVYLVCSQEDCQQVYILGHRHPDLLQIRRDVLNKISRTGRCGNCCEDMKAAKVVDKESLTSFIRQKLHVS